MRKFLKDYKPFIVSFLISITIFGSMFFIIYTFYSAKSNEQSAHMKVDDIPINNYYSPKLEDNLTFVLMCCEEENSNPSAYFLMHFNVIPNTCTVIEVSPNTYTNYYDMNKTIEEFYKYGGMKMASGAISNIFDLTSDVYIKMTMDQIKDFCNYFTGFKFELNNDIQTDMFSFQKGKQNMDGLRIASLLLDEKFNQKSELISSFLNLQFNKEVPKKLDDFYDFFYQNSTTNLSRVRLSEINKPIVRFFRNSDDKFIPYTLDTIQKNNFYYPNSDTIKNITEKIKKESVEPNA